MRQNKLAGFTLKTAWGLIRVCSIFELGSGPERL
jgi:hypothetical protein